MMTIRWLIILLNGQGSLHGGMFPQQSISTTTFSFKLIASLKVCLISVVVKAVVSCTGCIY